MAVGTIRIAGSGEALPRHKTLIDYVYEFGGSSWGITRRIDTHQALPSFMFSIDASSNEESMTYVLENVPVDRRTYLRRPKDPPAPVEVAVTFPVHGHLTNYAKKFHSMKQIAPLIEKKSRAAGVVRGVMHSNELKEDFYLPEEIAPLLSTLLGHWQYLHGASPGQIPNPHLSQYSI